MQKIMVILGTNRPERNGIKIARWFMEQAKKYDGVEYDFVDLAEYHLPYLDESIPPSSGVRSKAHTKDWSERVNAAGGFIIITPEYNHGYPAVLKNAIDYLFHEWAFKPVSFVSYGSAMGVRAVEQLRLVAIETKMVPIREQVLIPIFSQLGKNGEFKNTERDDARAQQVIGIMKRWAEILAKHRSELAA